MTRCTGTRCIAGSTRHEIPKFGFWCCSQQLTASCGKISLQQAASGPSQVTSEFSELPMITLTPPDRRNAAEPRGQPNPSNRVSPMNAADSE
ncbi:hypothetical protein K439DRAFT_688254 [Ramaria rubella]|nr:hypothetical protein K439DRAFT_688254 [Ramaria rubella]